jgi:hypothetical protein
MKFYNNYTHSHRIWAFIMANLFLTPIYTINHAPLFINNSTNILAEFPLYIDEPSYRIFLPYYKSLSQTWSNCPRY